MTNEQYIAAVEELNKQAQSIETSKRPAYTAENVDVLANFKQVASQLGMTPMQAWGVYFLKHISALTSFAKDHTIKQAEPIEGRFSDALNYIKLGYALMKEAGYQVMASDPAANHAKAKIQKGALIGVNNTPMRRLDPEYRCITTPIPDECPCHTSNQSNP